jgi:histidine triad (HIT) family protein
MNKQNPSVNALKKASKGLMLPSESDAPFEVVAWDEAGELDPGKMLQLAKQPKGTAVEESSLNDLFATVPSEDKAKFQALQKAIQDQLSGVKVYKVGDEPERQVFIIGRRKDGKLAGLKATVVET